MRKLILLLIIFSTTLFAQIQAEKTVVKYYPSENRTELTGTFLGTFNKLEGVFGTDKIADTLKKYFDVGFYFEEHNVDKNYYNQFKPMGYVAYMKRKVSSDIDTLVVKTDLINVWLDSNYYCYADITQKPNAGDNTTVKFRVTGTENEGQVIQDFACEPQLTSKQIQSKQWWYNVGDTVTFSIQPFLEGWCDTALTYNWRFARTDSVDTNGVAITWKPFYAYNSTKQGWISGGRDSITFFVPYKSWDEFKWQVTVSNSLGEIKSWARKLRVNQ